MTAAWILSITGLLLAAAAAAGWRLIRARNMQYWLGSYCFQRESLPDVDGAGQVTDVFIAICDHFEPECYGVSHERAIERVSRWVSDYPKRFSEFRDSSGRPPQHTFFFPADEYRPEYLDMLAELCAAGFGDVDIHLHHDDDTPENLRTTLAEFRDTLFYRHNLLRRDERTGEIVYGFIHGNWALCNSRPDGRWCGVDQELSILRETGCYADFTMPSAPSDTQTSTINSIYYARDLAGERKSHDTGIRARVGQQAPDDHLLMIQGPLELDWTNRKLGLLPRIENGDLHATAPPTHRRMQMWLRAGVHVAGRPEWRFVKLHTHGCKDGNLKMLLGPSMQKFHEELAAEANHNKRFRYHYVSAWEMAQIVHRAERGETDHGLQSSPSLLSAATTD
ncbi:hypothetical protein Mal4_27180 [Maioricimonas rarisocia]|uniref:Uncharacterized protein n=1 Tax=Maioricimonas rarisocia TaxID=2528026 RepID=A0A517Z7H2_9PLAN|nr:hypothetical protein [Maioricimonas rarisocia]QDU38391.1 hypothetical protein Mal4_27180 [Maioricimonas rarisocia]